MMRTLMPWVIVAMSFAGCGGSSSTAPASTDPSGPRPVRIDEPTPVSDTTARPVRTAPTVPGEAVEQDDLADPPPVEAPTAH